MKKTLIVILTALTMTLAGCAPGGAGNNSDNPDAPNKPGGGKLATALARISSDAEEGGAYTITIDADESLSPQTLFYNGKNVSVTLQGDETERTVDLSSSGSLFTIGSGVTLKLGNNITLRGQSDNTVSLVQVDGGGTLVMEDGSKISGNSSSGEDDGGGVYVSGGSFTMSDGEISGNSASRGGGGVSICYRVYTGNTSYRGGKFTMTGGTISGNTVSNWGYGGGVWVGRDNPDDAYRSGSASEAIFIMSGGTISGNSVRSSDGVHNSFGGGVYVDMFGDFTMNGGEISGNSASFGNGVYVDGRFTRSGGTISDKVSSEW
ncbi:MAG: hypothetical protein LBH75_05030 [Treponema sp.]|jgi:hypothetical protein|nr:hypothetical protein [Treponema sp.]